MFGAHIINCKQSLTVLARRGYLCKPGISLIAQISVSGQARLMCQGESQPARQADGERGRSNNGHSVPELGGAEPILLLLNYLSGASTVLVLLNHASLA